MIKTIVISKIVHLLISLPTPSQKVIREINTLLYKFLWNNKPDKIKRSISSLHLVEGGLNMLDFKMFDLWVQIVIFLLEPVFFSTRFTFDRVVIRAFYQSISNKSDILLIVV